MEPAQPPMNINNKKNTRGKFPHWSKSFVTYPVPVRIETTLNEIGQVAQQGMRARLGSAASSVLGRFAPSADDLYQDYFLRSRAGEQLAPTFGQALQAAYGLG